MTPHGIHGAANRLIRLFGMPCPESWHTCKILRLEETEYLNQWFGELWLSELLYTHSKAIDERIDWIDDQINAPHALCSEVFHNKLTNFSRVDFLVAFKDPSHAVHFRLRWDPINV